MLNFRKLKQDFPSAVLKEGKELYDKQCVNAAKILQLDSSTVRLGCQVKGSFDNTYESEIEIDRFESIAVDSNCDCCHSYDCQHIAAFLFYLESKIDEMIVNFSQQTNIDHLTKMDEQGKKELKKTIAEAVKKEDSRKHEKKKKELMDDYATASKSLSSSPFFTDRSDLPVQEAELLVILIGANCQGMEIQLALRVNGRSKPLHILKAQTFFEAIAFREPIILHAKQYLFAPSSFNPREREILTMLIDHARMYTGTDERLMRSIVVPMNTLGTILAKAFDLTLIERSKVVHREEKYLNLSPFCCAHVEEPLYCSLDFCEIQFDLEHLADPYPTLFLKPSFEIQGQKVEIADCELFESGRPGLLYENTYYRFKPKITREHLQNFAPLKEMVVCSPLFGTFIENSLPNLKRFAKVNHLEILKDFVTFPFAGELKGKCQVSYLDGELEAKVFFFYDKLEVGATCAQLKYDKILEFVTPEGILARNLSEERKILETCFEGFLFDEKEGIFRLKSEKKIVEFMTEVIPKFQDRITFECPENLSDQFVYDKSSFSIALKESGQIDCFFVHLKVDGDLIGVSVDQLWDCVLSQRRFLELKVGRKGSFPKILVLDLEKLEPLIQLFDELGIEKLDSHCIKRPLWHLAGFDENSYAQLPIQLTISPTLKALRQQMLGEGQIIFSGISPSIKAELRGYQVEGVKWLERLRFMHLSGILADDMGLGKTVQAICAFTACKEERQSGQTLIVCPTSLIYNWQEEIYKFNPKLTVGVIDAAPTKRRKDLKKISDFDVIITSYNLLQKDVEVYSQYTFNYIILDEAQHIKNRSTRNAKSVKQLTGLHRLILTGTPIENSLDELWSLFDFLLPGLLGTFERFMEKYIRTNKKHATLIPLKNKVAPFILRRMKQEVLDDLPAVSEILYHCSLSPKQQELYVSYAASAKEELAKLVKNEGFERIQIHVLATLTRLKQICCHPAIFAKEFPEEGDSAKYDMFLELLMNLIENRHKTVIFSQYTKMLSIMREDLTKRGISFAYLDGSSKNRLQIVKDFNKDPSILVFLVSLKAGGSGLNLTGADTVIHYDMWWNPAVESQATDRVHRIGQKKSVSSYKLVTLHTIEEKILQLQKRKRGLVQKVITSDDEVISKLTWEEVLELLQT